MNRGFARYSSTFVLNFFHITSEFPVIRRLPNGHQAGDLSSEPDFQPELDETPKSCVSTGHDTAEGTIGPSIRKDILRPKEVGVVANEYEIRSIDRVRIETADVA